MLTPGTLVHGAADVLAAGSVIGCAYLLYAIALVAWFKPERRGRGVAATPVTVLVPLCGDEPGLELRLSRLCHQAYPAPVQVLCGVRSAADPAVAIVRQVAADNPDTCIELHVDPRTHGCNLKISNLINMLRHARHETLVLVDSDIEVGRDFLALVTERLAVPGTGAVSTLYAGQYADSVWSRLAALGINSHFLPNVVVSLCLELATPCLGASIALSRTTLRRIGGFHAFADTWGEDHAIGCAIRELGLEVVMTTFAVGHVCAERTLRELFDAQLRSACTIRRIDPMGHAGGIITHPFPLALIAAALDPTSLALLLVCTAYACRTGLYWIISRRFGVPAESGSLLPFHDTLCFLAYLASWCGDTVTWRGQRYTVSGEAAAQRMR